MSTALSRGAVVTVRKRASIFCGDEGRVLAHDNNGTYLVQVERLRGIQGVRSIYRFAARDLEPVKQQAVA